LASSLGGCSASYIDLEAERDGGEIVFRNPASSWFSSDCVRLVEVTEKETGEVVWADGSLSSGCLFETPFTYGETSNLSDPDDLQPAQELMPGKTYEIFVELDGGAGDGSFTIEADGSIANTG
jgi:hypothetical protein